MVRLFFFMILASVGCLLHAEDMGLQRHSRQEQINSFLDEVYNEKIRFDTTKVSVMLSEYANHTSGIVSNAAIRVTRKDILRIANDIKLLGCSMSMTNVLERLGPPTYKLPRSQKNNDYSNGTCLKYYIVKMSLAYFDDRYDTCVSLYFDENDVFVYALVSPNLERMNCALGLPTVDK